MSAHAPNTEITQVLPHDSARWCSDPPSHSLTLVHHWHPGDLLECRRHFWNPLSHRVERLMDLSLPVPPRLSTTGRRMAAACRRLPLRTLLVALLDGMLSIAVVSCPAPPCCPAHVFASQTKGPIQHARQPLIPLLRINIAIWRGETRLAPQLSPSKLSIYHPPPSSVTRPCP